MSTGQPTLQHETEATLMEMLYILTLENKAKWVEFYKNNPPDFILYNDGRVEQRTTPEQRDYLRQLYAEQQAEAAKVEAWPQCGDQYFTASPTSRVEQEIWGDANYDHKLKAMGNVFRTTEEAEAESRYREAEAWLRGEQGRRNEGHDIRYMGGFDIQLGDIKWGFGSKGDQEEVREELWKRRTLDDRQTYHEALSTQGRIEEVTT